MQVGTELVERNNGIGRASTWITVDPMKRAEFPDTDDLISTMQGVCNDEDEQSKTSMSVDITHFPMRQVVDVAAVAMRMTFWSKATWSTVHGMDYATAVATWLVGRVWMDDENRLTMGDFPDDNDTVYSITLEAGWEGFKDWMKLDSPPVTGVVFFDRSVGMF